MKFDVDKDSDYYCDHEIRCDECGEHIGNTLDFGDDVTDYPSICKTCDPQPSSQLVFYGESYNLDTPLLHKCTNTGVNIIYNPLTGYEHVVSSKEIILAFKIQVGIFPFLNLPLLINHPFLKYFAMLKLLGDPTCP